MSIPDVVIIAGARTPFARINGNLANQTAVQLGTVAIRGALEKVGVSPDAVDAVPSARCSRPGAGENPAQADGRRGRRPLGRARRDRRQGVPVGPRRHRGDAGMIRPGEDRGRASAGRSP